LIAATCADNGGVVMIQNNYTEFHRKNAQSLKRYNCCDILELGGFYEMLQN